MLNKITFIGAGDLGSQAAFLTVQQKIAREIVLLDIDAGTAQGRAMDMEQSLGADSSIKIIGTSDYAHAVGTDIFIVTAGKALPSTGGYDRQALLKDNVQILNSVFTSAYAQAPDAIFIIVTNPVYTLTTWIAQNFPVVKNKLIGFGSSLDSLRYQHYSKNPTALVVGNHGDDMVLVGDEDTVTLDQVTRAAAHIIELLGNHSTVYAPAAQITKLITAIANDTQEVIPVGKLAAGEWGINDVVIGMPCVIGREGIISAEIDNIQLTEAEKVQLQQSAENISSTLAQIQL